MMKRQINLTIAREPLPDNIKGFSAKRGAHDYLIVIHDALTEEEAAEEFKIAALNIWRDNFNQRGKPAEISKGAREEIKRLVYGL
jgi:hypothetical protein